MKRILELAMIVALLIALASMLTVLKPTVTEAQRGPKPNTWVEEHSGHPYVGADVHYVLDAGPNIGRPRPAVVTLAGFAHQRVNLKVFLSPGDVPEGEPLELNPERVRFDSGGEPGTCHWPPDPRNFRTLGQEPQTQ